MFTLSSGFRNALDNTVALRQKTSVMEHRQGYKCQNTEFRKKYFNQDKFVFIGALHMAPYFRELIHLSGKSLRHLAQEQEPFFRYCKDYYSMRFLSVFFLNTAVTLSHVLNMCRVIFTTSIWTRYTKVCSCGQRSWSDLCHVCYEQTFF